MTGSSARVVCDRYELIEILGRGGMGVVWRARDRRLKREVAIKEVEIPPAIPDRDRAALQARALREARAAARLSRSSAVTVFDVQQEDGRAYLVMELVDAPSLAQLVADEGPLEAPRAAQIGLDVLDALEGAHGAGIVHRDVKPGNVMVPSEGTAKLADFGIASLKDDPKITQTGLLLGSPSYMAPEQAEGTGSGPETDLWALGATLFFVVEGHAPFDEGQAIPTLGAVINDEPRRMQRAGPLRSVIEALLSKSAGDRPSIDETRARLEAVTAPAPRTAPAVPERPLEAATPAPVTSSPRRPQRRLHRFLAVAALLLVALLSAAIGWLAGGDSPPTTGGASNESRPGDRTGQGNDPQSGPQAPQENGPAPAAGEAPGGWATYDEPTTGYSIAYPESWEIVENPIDDGSSTDFRDPETGGYLRVDWTSDPGPSAVGAWEALEPDFASRHAGYRRIGNIDPTTFQGYEAAVWEFGWTESDTRMHSVDLGFIVTVDDEPTHGFALNSVAPEVAWDGLQDEFIRFQETFSGPGSG